MIPRHICLWAVILFLTAPLTAQEIRSFVPERIDTRAWKSVDNPRLFVGDSLFDFIDGGAAIYQEYGFRQVVAREYTDSSGRSLNVEVYQMSDPAAAFGIFSFQRGDNAQPITLGDAAVNGSYYISFWKDRYLVMITAPDSSRETNAALMNLAQQLDKRIPGHGQPPLLVHQVEGGIAGCTRLVYVRGYLGLLNQYDFGASDPFGTSEGVVVTCSDAMLVALEYASQQKAVEAFDAAGPILERAPRFSSFSRAGNSLHCIDRDGNHIILTKHGRYLLAAIAHDVKRVENALQRISSLL